MLFKYSITQAEYMVRTQSLPRSDEARTVRRRVREVSRARAQRARRRVKEEVSSEEGRGD